MPGPVGTIVLAPNPVGEVVLFSHFAAGIRLAHLAYAPCSSHSNTRLIVSHSPMRRFAGTSSPGVGSLYSSDTKFPPSDPPPGEPGRLPDGRRMGRKGPRRVGESCSLRTSVRLVVLHAVAGRRSCARAARWVSARGPGAGEWTTPVAEHPDFGRLPTPLSIPPAGVFARWVFQAARRTEGRGS